MTLVSQLSLVFLQNMPIFDLFILVILTGAYFDICVQVEPTATVLDIKALFHKSCE